MFNKNTNLVPEHRLNQIANQYRVQIRKQSKQKLTKSIRKKLLQRNTAILHEELTLQYMFELISANSEKIYTEQFAQTLVSMLGESENTPAVYLNVFFNYAFTVMNEQNRLKILHTVLYDYECINSYQLQQILALITPSLRTKHLTQYVLNVCLNLSAATPKQLMPNLIQSPLFEQLLIYVQENPVNDNNKISICQTIMNIAIESPKALDLLEIIQVVVEGNTFDRIDDHVNLILKSLIESTQGKVSGSIQAGKIIKHLILNHLHRVQMNQTSNFNFLKTLNTMTSRALPGFKHYLIEETSIGEYLYEMGKVEKIKIRIQVLELLTGLVSNAHPVVPDLPFFVSIYCKSFTEETEETFKMRTLQFFLKVVELDIGPMLFNSDCFLDLVECSDSSSFSPELLYSLLKLCAKVLEESNQYYTTTKLLNSAVCRLVQNCSDRQSMQINELLHELQTIIASNL